MICFLTSLEKAITKDARLKKAVYLMPLIELGSAQLFKTIDEQFTRQADPEVLKNLTRFPSFFLFFSLDLVVDLSSWICF